MKYTLETWLIFGHGASGMMTFDLPTCKWGSRVTGVMGLLPANLQLLMPFYSRLRVRHRTDGRTDGQTNTINALCL